MDIGCEVEAKSSGNLLAHAESGGQAQVRDEDVHRRQRCAVAGQGVGPAPADRTELAHGLAGYRQRLIDPGADGRIVEDDDGDEFLAQRVPARGKPGHHGR